VPAVDGDSVEGAVAVVAEDSVAALGAAFAWSLACSVAAAVLWLDSALAPGSAVTTLGGGSGLEPGST